MYYILNETIRANNIQRLKNKIPLDKKKQWVYFNESRTQKKTQLKQCLQIMKCQHTVLISQFLHLAKLYARKDLEILKTSDYAKQNCVSKLCNIFTYIVLALLATILL